MKIESRYKAQTGTYVSAVPERSAYGYLSNLLGRFAKVEHAGRLSVPADLHCTVMFAPNNVLTPKQQLEILSQTRPFRATAKALTIWQGGDNDSYLVLELTSPDLEAAHLRLKDEFGLAPTFAVYRPHITLISGLPAAPEASYDVDPVALMLTGLRIEDTK